LVDILARLSNGSTAGTIQEIERFNLNHQPEIDQLASDLTHLANLGIKAEDTLTTKRMLEEAGVNGNKDK